MIANTHFVAGDQISSGVFVSVDGPGGVGKSALVRRLSESLWQRNICTRITTEPTRSPLGDLLRHGTDTYHGLALACLVAGDRHHHLDSEIRPALQRGEVVISDRYFPSSLVLQRMDGLDWDLIWQLNIGVVCPDVVVIVNADPDVIASRVAVRGKHSRFERQPAAERIESDLYDDTRKRLEALGWPVYALDSTEHDAGLLAAEVLPVVCRIISSREVP